MSSDLRWTKWWWADWQTDPALRMCSLAARGLWLEMLALMHSAEPQGHLLVSGRSPSARQLAALVGATEKEVARLIAELEEAAVFSRTEDGLIFSRRMVRDISKRTDARENGKNGGNPHIQRGTAPKEARVRPYRRGDNPAKEGRIWAKSNGRCHWCQRALQRDQRGPDFFHIGHVVPVRDGGDNSDTNLVATCTACHFARTRVDPTTSDEDGGTRSDMNRSVSVGPPSAVKLEAEAEAEADTEAIASAQTVGSDEGGNDPRAVLFRRGLDTVASLCGKPARSLRGFLGLLLQQAGDDPRIVLEAIDAAAASQPAEPQSWLRNAVRIRSQRRPSAIEDEPWFRELATKERSSGRWCIGGFYFDGACEMVRDAARIPDADARNWEPLARWLHAGRDLHDHVIPAIRRMASRPGYQPPASLRFFEAAVLDSPGASS